MVKGIKKPTSKSNPDQGGLALPETPALGFQQALNRFEKQNRKIGSERVATHIAALRKSINTFEAIGAFGILSPVVKASVKEIPSLQITDPAEKPEANLLTNIKRTMTRLAKKHDAERPKSAPKAESDPQWRHRIGPNVIARKRPDPAKYTNPSRR